MGSGLRSTLASKATHRHREDNAEDPLAASGSRKLRSDEESFTEQGDRTRTIYWTGLAYAADFIQM